MLHQTPPPARSDAPALTQRARLRPRNLLDRARRRRDSGDRGWSLVELMAVITIGMVITAVGYVLFIQGTDTAYEAVTTANFATVRDRLRTNKIDANDIGANDILTSGVGGYITQLNAGVAGVEIVDINAWLGGTRGADKIGIWANPFPVTITDGGSPAVTDKLLPGQITVLINSDGENTRCIVNVASAKFPSGDAFMHVRTAPPATGNLAVTGTTANTIYLDDLAHCGLANTGFTTATVGSSACRVAGAIPTQTVCGLTANSFTFGGTIDEFQNNMQNSTGTGSTADSLLDWTAVTLTGTTPAGGTDGTTGRCFGGWPTQNDTATPTETATCPS